MEFIDGFAGVGGFRLPLEQLGHKCVWSCDNNKYSEQVYRYNFGEGYNAKAIEKAKTSDIPRHDLFCAGFPCPDFSIAGQRKGLEGTHGELFYEIVRIARDKRTPYLLLENVRGLLNSNGGWDFARIQIELGKLGYDLQWQILNSKDYGVPQNRPRVFIIGHLGGYPRPQVFPIKENGAISKEENKSKPGSAQTPITRPIRQKADRGEDTFIIHDRRQSNDFRKETKPCVTKHYGTGGGNVPLIIHPQRRNENTPSIQKARKMGLPDPCGHGQLYRNDGLTYTLTGFPIQIVKNISITDSHIRRITPLECERLQGFPDNWTQWGINAKGKKIVISDTQRYRMMGNAVTTNIIFEIMNTWSSKNEVPAL